MSRFIYPEDDAAIQSMLKNRATQLKAEVKDAMQKGITLDMEIEQQYRDVEMIREKLTTREERYFENSFYINVYDDNEEKLKETGKKIEQKISGYGIQRMDEGFAS
jgi:type IV secretory pathway VirB4 component